MVEKLTFDEMNSDLNNWHEDYDYYVEHDDWEGAMYCLDLMNDLIWRLRRRCMKENKLFFIEARRKGEWPPNE